MLVVEFLQKEYSNTDIDNGSVDYLQSIIDDLKSNETTSLDDIRELVPLIESVVGESVPEDSETQDALCKRLAQSCGVTLSSQEDAPLQPVRVPEPAVLNVTVDTPSERVLENVALPVAPRAKTKKKKTKQKGKVVRTKKKDEEDPQPSASSPEGFSTKRFEKNHRNWMGNEKWKVQDHALTLATEELDDDDYSSAWLECLRKGIPWGGRGAGGRGVQRVTGEAKDIKIPNVSMSRGANTLLEDATLLVVQGSKYGIVGRNGVGKTTLLRRIALGALPGFPPWVRVQYVEQELKGTEMSPVDYVVKFDYERTRLMLEETQLLNDEEADLEGKRMAEIYTRLEQIDAFTAESRAETTLRSLGFDDAKLQQTTSELSGGWRMRVALAGAIFMDPDLLVLDEPTNHLDVLASEWLKRYLSEQYKGSILFVSHDRSFLNVVATDIIEFRNHKLFYFAGKYDQYRKFLEEQRQNVENEKSARMKSTESMKQYVDKQRREANKKGSDPKKLAQIRSKEKRIHRHSQLEKSSVSFSYNQLKYSDLDAINNAPASYRSQASGRILKVVAYDPGKPITFKFHQCQSLRSQEMMSLTHVTAGYPNAAPLFVDVNLAVKSSSKIAIIGANGTGKSSLLKFMLEQLPVTKGQVKCGSSVKCGYFAQNRIDELDKSLTPVELLVKAAAELPSYDGKFNDLAARSLLGKFSLSGRQQLQTIATLSGGQKSRVVLAKMTLEEPNLLIFDEPTNHLDIESIEALSLGIREFNGAVIVVSHDIHFVSSLCEELWILKSRRRKRDIVTFGSTAIEVYPKVENVMEKFDKYLSTQNLDQ